MTAELFENLKALASEHNGFVEIKLCFNGAGTVSASGQYLFEFFTAEELTANLKKLTAGRKYDAETV